MRHVVLIEWVGDALAMPPHMLNHCSDYYALLTMPPPPPCCRRLVAEAPPRTRTRTRLARARMLLLSVGVLADFRANGA